LDNRHTDFNDATAAAKAKHAEALKAATHDFNAACRAAREQWQAHREAVERSYAAVKSTPGAEGFAAAQRAFRSLQSDPDISLATRDRDRANKAADETLNSEFAAARAALHSAPAPAR
jgi:hypothetical protein